MIYFAILFLLFSASFYIDILKIKKHENIIYYFFMFFLILLAGLRFRVGSDTITYLSNFQQCPKLFNLLDSDFSRYNYKPLWMIYFSIFKTYGNFYLLQLSNAFLINFAIFRFGIKYCNDFKFIYILLYYSLFYIGLNFEIMRQALAIALCIKAIDYLIHKGYLKYYVLIIIGSLIHEGALIFFILPLVSLVKLNNRTSIIIIILLFLLSAFFTQYLLYASLYFVQVLGDTNLNEKYNIYSATNGKVNLNYYLNYMYIPIFLVLSSIIYLTKKKVKIPFYNYLVLFSCVSVLSSGFIILGRFSSSLFIFPLLCISKTLYICINKIRSFIVYCMLYVVIILSQLIYYNAKFADYKFYNKYYPYSSCFNEFYDYKRESQVDASSLFK